MAIRRDIEDKAVKLLQNGEVHLLGPARVYKVGKYEVQYLERSTGPAELSCTCTWGEHNNPQTEPDRFCSHAIAAATFDSELEGRYFRSTKVPDTKADNTV